MKNTALIGLCNLLLVASALGQHHSGYPPHADSVVESQNWVQPVMPEFELSESKTFADSEDNSPSADKLI